MFTDGRSISLLDQVLFNRPVDPRDLWPHALPLVPDSGGAKLLYRLWTGASEELSDPCVGPTHPHPWHKWEVEWDVVESLDLPDFGTDVPIEVNTVISQVVWRMPAVAVSINHWTEEAEQGPFPPSLWSASEDRGLALMVLHSRSSGDARMRTWTFHLGGDLGCGISDLPLDVVLAGGL